MTKSYTSCIDTLPMAIDNVKRITYRHRGKYGKKKLALRLKMRRNSYADKLQPMFQDVLDAMSLLRNMPPVEYVDKRPINENIYKVD